MVVEFMNADINLEQRIVNYDAIGADLNGDF